MSISVAALTAEQLLSYLATFSEYETLAEAIAQGGFYILEDGTLASTALVATGGAGMASFSATGTALELAELGGLTATGTNVGTAAIGLAGTGTGYTAVGLTYLELGTAAAACAPLLGVSLGANLYESNPSLWTKLSQKLLPFCYPGTTKVPAWIDIIEETGAYKLLVKLGLIDALEEFFEEEGMISSVKNYSGNSAQDSYYGTHYYTQQVVEWSKENTYRSVKYEGAPVVATSGGSVVALSLSSGATVKVIYEFWNGQISETTYSLSNIMNITRTGQRIYYIMFSASATLAALSNTSNIGILADIFFNGIESGGEAVYPEGTSEWTGTIPEVLPWTQPIIVIPDPVGPDYQPIPTPVTPISPQIVPELPPHTDPIPLPPHVDPVEPVQPTEPEYPPENWPEEEPWPSVIPFPWTDPTPDPDNPWPEYIPWPLPEVPPYQWPTVPYGWPTEVPVPQPWPASPEDWPEESPWPDTPPSWWPINPWPQTPEDWPEEVPWPDTPPSEWPEEIPWPDTPGDWPEEIPWPNPKPDDWPEIIPWPDSPSEWPDDVPWPVPWPPEWPDDVPWPPEWPEDLPYPWEFPLPAPSPDPDDNPDPIVDPTSEEVDPYIEPVPIPWDDPEPGPSPYDPDPSPPDPEADPSQPQPIPDPETPPYEPDPPVPSDESPDPFIDPIIPLPNSATTGLITVYNPSQTELLNFANWLWVTWEDATIEKIWNNPFDGIITLFELYCDPTVEGRKTIRSGFLDSNVESNYISRYTSINCGSIGVPEFYGNYLDYSPYSKAHIYLPFIGVVELNVDDIVGHAVNVLYHIDEYNGSCIAQITVAKVTEVNGETISYSNTFYQFSGNCAVELPIAGGSQAAIKAGMLQAAAYGLGSVIGGVISGGMTGGLAGAIAGGASGLAYGAANAVSSVVSAKSSVQHSGSFGASYGAMGIKTPFITITRPKQIQVPNYEAMYGFPAHKAVVIGQCTGFLRCREVHIHSSTASDEESALIEQMLKEGVIIGDSE